MAGPNDGVAERQTGALRVTEPDATGPTVAAVATVDEGAGDKDVTGVPEAQTGALVVVGSASEVAEPDVGAGPVLVAGTGGIPDGDGVVVGVAGEVVAATWASCRVFGAFRLRLIIDSEYLLAPNMAFRLSISSWIPSLSLHTALARAARHFWMPDF